MLFRSEVEAALAFGERDLEFAPSDPVAGIAGLAREIELRGQRPPAGCRDLHVDMRRASRIAAGPDRREIVATFRVGDQMSP